MLASSLAAQSTGTLNPDQVLAETKAKIVAMTRNLPRYTCTETVNREYFRAETRMPAGSCQRDSHLQLLGKDRFRLDVTEADSREIFAWAGASRFDSRRVDQIVKDGPTSSGAFGTYLIEIFAMPGTEFEYLQRQVADGRTLLEYHYRVPKEFSRYGLGRPGHLHLTGYEGTFQVDAQNSQLRKVEIQTDQLLPDTDMCSVATTLVYQRGTTGDSGFLLPAETRQSILRPNGEVHNARTTFSACHEYTAESVIRFGDESAESSTQTGSLAQQRILPEDLPVTLALMEQIDSETAAAGDSVSAKVARNVTANGTKEVLIPSGAVVRGRITDMRTWMKPYRYFVFSITWETVDIRGVVTPFSAKLDRSAESQKARLAAGRRGGRGSELILPPSGWHKDPTSLLFTMTGNRYVVEKGFTSIWLTTTVSSQTE